MPAVVPNGVRRVRYSGLAADAASPLFLPELRQRRGGGLGHVRKWKSRIFTPDFQARNRILQKLLGKGTVESYDAPDGNKALRIRMGTSGPALGDAAGGRAVEGGEEKGEPTGRATGGRPNDLPGALRRPCDDPLASHCGQLKSKHGVMRCQEKWSHTATCPHREKQTDADPA